MPDHSGAGRHCSPLLRWVGDEEESCLSTLQPHASQTTLLIRVDLYQPVQERPPLIDGFHPDALIQTMRVSSIRVIEGSVDAIGRDAGGVQELSIRGTGGKGRDH